VSGFVNSKKGCTRLAAASDKVYQLLAHGRWYSPASSTTKTGHHDTAEILLKVALNTINKSINQSRPRLPLVYLEHASFQLNGIFSTLFIIEIL